METAWESLNRLVLIFLENIAFIELFITSLVVQSVLDCKKFYFDTEDARLYKDKVIKFVLYQNNRHYIFTAIGVPYSYPQNATKVPAIRDNTFSNNLFEEQSVPMAKTHISSETTVSENNIDSIFRISTSLEEINLYQITENMCSGRVKLDAQDEEIFSTPLRDWFTKVFFSMIFNRLSTENSTLF